MIVVEATPDLVRYVVVHMREESAAEAFASRPDDDYRGVAEDLVRALPHFAALKVLAGDDGEPVCLVGVIPEAASRAIMVFLATARFPEQLRASHRWWRHEFVPKVMCRFRRVTFVGSLPNTISGRWLGWLGFECEGIARAHGKNGEDFAFWAWINPVVLDDARPGLGLSPQHREVEIHV